MEDKIPIPTDNIYKFYALFGLVLFIFCAGSFIFVQEKTNDLLVQPRLVTDNSRNGLTRLNFARTSAAGAA